MSIDDTERLGQGRTGLVLGCKLYSNLIRVVVILFLTVLTAETVLRIVFPWDRLTWQETSFVVNMMKLNHHLPVQTAPQDCNSNIYSPGMEYLTFAVLKPLGLALDLRWYRVVSTILGMLAALFGALTVIRFLGAGVPRELRRFFGFTTWGLLWLVLSQNFESDMPHADNLHALHATVVLWLAYYALDTSRFGIALLAMAAAGMGVITKQTEACSWLGAWLAFALFNPWGWRRWLVLGVVGAGMCCVSFYVLWLPEYGKFFTFTLPSSDRLEPERIKDLVKFLTSQWRLMLLVLAVAACFGIWNTGGRGRRYLACWGAIGVFTAAPGLVSFLKALALYNNVILLFVWLMLIVWPMIVLLSARLQNVSRESGAVAPRSEPPERVMAQSLMLLFVILLVMLVPLKPIPRHADYAFCRAVESAVQADLRAGRRVLVTYGAGFYLRSGIDEPPLDQGISAIELHEGRHDDLFNEFKARIEKHYYDRVYLMLGYCYDDVMTQEISKNYRTKSVIPCSGKVSQVMRDCTILEPKPSP